MTAQTVTPYHSTVESEARDGFRQLVRSEWTKFRTVRGWLIGMALAAVITVAIGVLGPLGSSTQCASSDGRPCGKSEGPPVGPNGETVSDGAYLVHQAVTGDGSISARVTSLTGYYTGDFVTPPTSIEDLKQGVEPWARAGIIVKASATPGAPYVAVVATGANGIRLESDFTMSKAGSATAVASGTPRWLRLTRTGDTFTGYESADGVNWTAIGTVTAAGIPRSARAGMLVGSPNHSVTTRSFASTGTESGPSLAVATFDGVGLTGGWTDSGTWTAPGAAQHASGAPQPLMESLYERTAAGFTVRGSGDVAPDVSGPGGQTRTIENGLAGVFAGLIALIVVAALFITSEYRRGLIRTTFGATPHRGRVLAAKSVVVGAVAFVTGLVAAGVAVPLVESVERGKGMYVRSVSGLTEARVIVGTALLLAAVAVFALALGTVLRRGAGAVTLVIAVVVLPYVLAVASVLPAGTADWLLRLTPAAGFAVQQSSPKYLNFPEVTSGYTPVNGYFPLAPWVGFTVTCAYAAAAFGLALYLLRRRDA